jgi:uncharacterized protein (DUF169 family)
MDMAFKEKFVALWKKFFNDTALPIIFYYTDDSGRAGAAKPGSTPRCVIGALAQVREKGRSLAMDVNGVGCPGGKRYLGFSETLAPDFEYFLSCGIPGKREGERYKKSPELVREYLKQVPAMAAPGRYIIFKRWDKLDAADHPDVVIFFVQPDALSGLFTLASFDEATQDRVIAPFGSGCASIVQYPYMESKAEQPRAVIGMFDVSARPFVPADVLTFAIPMEKFRRMVENMEESFLITPSWSKVQSRLNKI